ncbi:hypothetical protein NGM10_16300 (plasmid) [Halorussus salilacus]|uniref:hypothetical protein n=1 Tax=Halorussus salilacus TaxID=2953750 RepID=UPI00209CA77A|nr:hypothetical protein [Halorussus salilacus]USZ69964.1 hypothetical protein NGM10_16300 [Halorussus salilacus]
MAVRNKVSFWEMFRELPGRTAVASVVPVLLGVAQLVNGYLHGVPVTHTGAFAVVMAAAAVVVTRYHLVAFHRAKLQRSVFGDRGPVSDD